MDIWNARLKILLPAAERARQRYMGARDVCENAQELFSFALRNLREHAERKPQRADIGPVDEERLKDLLRWPIS